ncbi:MULTISPECIES: HTH domain-containing protein [Haloferax]|uniref:Uncharacterized protein n=2 Tax=Haloferax TaxID=2251 RepID=A0A6G1Z5V5_9EURY|nr:MULTISPECIES: HTH domain-containing protein [Haloferax]KAB1189296.1 hypothetical protein Hfx1149_13810 [Haloferax sp. CBA1149]MRW81781.1 hypothetical protein [Haloferax marinisediminis]
MDSTKGGERPTQPSRPVRVELWVPSGKRDEFEAVVARLDDAVEHGVVDDYTVETWDRFVDLSGRLNSRERHVRDKLSSYARWSANRGRQLSGLGDPITRGIGRMGPECLTRRVPRAVMAEYEEGILSHVTACEECVGALQLRLDDLDSHTEPDWSNGPITVEW